MRHVLEIQLLIILSERRREKKFVRVSTLQLQGFFTDIVLIGFCGTCAKNVRDAL
jgi:hypothetical protein